MPIDPNNLNPGGATTNATVVIGEITFDGTPANFVDPTPGAVFTDNMVTNTYESDKHTYMAGVTSPGGFRGNSAAFFRLANPTLLWVCDWTASRAGIKPQIPDPSPPNADWELLDEVHQPAQMTLMGDGVTPLYRHSGTYYYGHHNPPAQPVSVMSYPRAPWVENGAADRTVTTDQFNSTISSAQQAGGGFFGGVQ